jgi:ribosomal protein S27AE
METNNTDPKIEIIDIGNAVICDMCDADYTNSDEKGGFLFGRKAVCPKCAEETMANIVKFHEQRHISGLCPSTKSFRDWVLQDLRNGNNIIKIKTWEQ